MLGPRIAALRREAGMSQAELAQRLQISPSAVGMYEQGRREPSVDTLVTMAEVFGVTTDFLLTGKAAGGAEEDKLVRMLTSSLSAMDARLEHRAGRPFSRQELAVLMAAMLIEP